MRRVKFFVMRVGEHWEVLCHGHRAATTHPSRLDAVDRAREAALALWKDRRVASEVVISEDDGSWHSVATFGELLDP